MSGNKPIYMHLPVELHKGLKKVCAANEISMKQFIIDSILERLNRVGVLNETKIK